jgi:hypothetical protein
LLVAIFTTQEIAGSLTFARKDDARDVFVVDGVVTAKGASLVAGQQYGLHVHAFGDLRDGCASTGQDFHFSLKDGRISGDLANITAIADLDATQVSLQVSSLQVKHLDLCGPRGIAARSVVVTENDEDHTSVGCALIGLANME